MKNWAVALSTTFVRAIASVPRLFASPLSASFLIAARVGFCVKSLVKPPPWIMKPGITRWKIVPSKKPSSTYLRKFSAVTGAFSLSISTSITPSVVVSRTTGFPPLAASAAAGAAPWSETRPSSSANDAAASRGPPLHSVTFPPSDPSRTGVRAGGRSLPGCYTSRSRPRLSCGGPRHEQAREGNPLLVRERQPGYAREPRADAEPRTPRREREARDPAGRSGLRAWPGAQLREESRGLRPALPLRARDRRGLQRLRRAARLPRGGRRRVRGRHPADLEAEQLRLALWRERSGPGRDRQRGRRAAPRLRRDRLHDLPGLGRAQRDVPADPHARRGGQAQGARRGDLVLSARLRNLEEGRDGNRRGRLRRPDRRAARRTRDQGEAADGTHRAGGREEGLRERAHPDRDAGRSRAPRGGERVRRPPHRDLLRWRGQGRGRLARGDPRHRRGRRLRLDRGPQLVPAREGRGHRAAARDHGHLRPARVARRGRGPPVRPSGTPTRRGFEHSPDLDPPPVILDRIAGVGWRRGSRPGR